MIFPTRHGQTAASPVASRVYFPLFFNPATCPGPKYPRKKDNYVLCPRNCGNCGIVSPEFVVKSCVVGKVPEIGCFLLGSLVYSFW